MILKEVKHNKIQRSQHKIIKLNIIKTNKSIIIRMKFYQKMLGLPEFKLIIILKWTSKITIIIKFRII